jgi:hypothetical protein
MLTCTSSTAFFLNSSFFLAFSVIGFMILLTLIKEVTVFESGLISLSVGASVCILFVGCSMKTITNQYL